MEVANQKYRSEMDILAPFIEDCCVLGPEYQVKSMDLYEAYKGWCEENGERELSQKKLIFHLLERGDITKKRFGHQGSKGLQGIGLTSVGQSNVVGS